MAVPKDPRKMQEFLAASAGGLSKIKTIDLPNRAVFILVGRRSEPLAQFGLPLFRVLKTNMRPDQDQ